MIALRNPHSRWPALLRIAGVVLLIAGLQAWGFNRQASPLIEEAYGQLASLRQEVPDNRLMNLSLRSLQDFWRATDDELAKTQVLELRDAVLERFGADPAAAVGEFANVVASFEARSDVEQESLASLRRHAAELEHMYTDHFEAAITAVSRPPWYLQPTASFLNNDRVRNRALRFNHALYLMHVRDMTAAVGILDELRRDGGAEPGSDPLTSRILFALSRLQFEAFQVEQNQTYFREALQYAQQSVRSDADYALPKLFLEYLLSIDKKATEVDMSPLEGEGEGEGEGERGAIATEPGEF